MSTDKKQYEKFKKVARELGCDEDEKAFDQKLKKVATASPPKSVQKRKALKKNPKAKTPAG